MCHIWIFPELAIKKGELCIIAKSSQLPQLCKGLERMLHDQVKLSYITAITNHKYFS